MQAAPSLIRRTAFIAVLALLLAQALGLAHGVAHPRAADSALHAAAAHADGADQHAHHDEGSPQCRLLDQLTHADLLAPAAAQVPLVVAAPLACVAVMPAPAPRLVVWRVRARGPPTLLA